MLNRDPYEVLGVDRTATQEEIRTAYRALVKKYHPDKYQGNPLADLAEEKLQEINEAYDVLTKSSSQGAQPAGGGTSYSYSSYGYGSYGPRESSASGSPVYNEIRAAINRNDLRQAENLLNSCSVRDAEWQFLTGVLCFRQGKISDAVSCVKTAMEMDPDNQEYRTAYAQMNSAGNMYRSDSQAYGYGNAVNPADMMLCSLPFCLCC